MGWSPDGRTAVTFYAAVRMLFGPVGKLYFGMRIEGIANVPAAGPAIIAANHVSLLDPAVLGSACPRPMRFLISRRVYEKAAMRWFYERMRAIPVGGESDRGLWLRSALRTLGQGGLVGVFPEGAGLTSAGGEREGMPGALLIAALSGAPTIPVGLSGTFEAWPPGRRFPRPGRVVVRFGEPYSPLHRGERPDRERLRSCAEELMLRVRALRNGSRS